MPIRPENKARYPKNWSSEIRPAILERAKNDAGWPCCEQCGVPNGEKIARNPDGTWSHALSDEDGVVIVLTIAHLNHTPEDCAHSNLRAWCQKCHNAYDAPVRAAGIKARRLAVYAIGDLFDADINAVRNLPGRPVEQQADGAPGDAVQGGDRHRDREGMGSADRADRSPAG
jgi:hypothetical protein